MGSQGELAVRHPRAGPGAAARGGVWQQQATGAAASAGGLPAAPLPLAGRRAFPPRLAAPHHRQVKVSLHTL